MSGGGATDHERTGNRLDFGGRDVLLLREPAGDASGATEAVVVPRSGGDATLGVVWGGNPLREPLAVSPGLPGRLILAWSGTLGDELFTADPRTWLRSGHEALAAFCERMASGLQDARRRLCFHPHARHVLSDPVSCLRFVREHERGPFDVALAPASMLEPSMTADVEDHLRRSFEMLGPVAALVILEVEPLPPDLLLDLLDRHVPAATPVLLLD